MLLRNLISVAMICAIGMGLSGCPRKVVIKFPTIHFFAPDTNPQVASLQAQAAESAANGGYDNAEAVVEEIDMPQVLASIDAGQSSSAAFASYAINNAYLANVTGTSVVEMVTNGNTIASAAFPYHVSGPYLVFDNPGSVDQWIVSNRWSGAQTLRVTVPDMMVGTAGDGSEVTVSMTAMNNSTPLASGTGSYFAPRRVPRDCFTTQCPILTNE